MTPTTQKKLALAEFLASPQSSDRCELVNGEAVPKVSPKRFHSQTQKALLKLLEDWAEGQGEVGIEWSVILERQERAWVPIPDLLYVSKKRLPDIVGDQPCPVPPDLAIEIISPEQTFGEMVSKATDYLSAGVLRVWVVDPRAKSLTVFYPDAPPRTYREDALLSDPLLEGLTLTVQRIFQQAKLPN